MLCVHNVTPMTLVLNSVVYLIRLVVVMIGLLSSQVKKAVGGQARGMALYEDDVRPPHGPHTLYIVQHNYSAAHMAAQNIQLSLWAVYIEKEI